MIAIMNNEPSFMLIHIHGCSQITKALLPGPQHPRDKAEGKNID
jgi:hypothetical protein